MAIQSNSYNISSLYESDLLQVDNLINSPDFKSQISSLTINILQILSNLHLSELTQKRYEALIEKIKIIDSTETKVNQKISKALLQAELLINSEEDFTSEAFIKAADDLINICSLEVLAKLPATFILIHQLYDKAAEKLLKNNEDFLKVLEIRLQAVKNLLFFSNHPLYNMTESINFQTKKQSDSRFGCYFSSLGTNELKSGNLHAGNRLIDGKACHYIDFKVNDPNREEFKQTLLKLETLISSRPDELKKLLEPLGIEEIKMQLKNFVFKKGDEKGAFTTEGGYSPITCGQRAEAIEIEFIGKGKLIVEQNPNWRALYNLIMVEIKQETKEGEGLKDLQTMFTLLGLGPVLGIQRKDDDRKIQISQLIKTYLPKIAYEMKTTNHYLKLPLVKLIQKLEIENKDSIPNLFDKYLFQFPQLMAKHEVYPNKWRWSVTDLSEQIKRAKGCGLFMGVDAPSHSIETACKILKLLLTNGSLCTMDRFLNGLFSSGASSEQDMWSGGACGVFTRLITDPPKVSIQKYDFHGIIQICFSLEVLDYVGGSYGYKSDSFGTKVDERYENRLNLIELTKKIHSSLEYYQPFDDVANEIAIPDRIPPRFISGVMTMHSSNKKLIMEFLKKEGLTELRNEKEYVIANGIPLNDFVYADTPKFRPQMFKLDKNN